MIEVDMLFNSQFANNRTPEHKTSQGSWPFKWTCHTTSTLEGREGEEELRAFAARMGLKPQWIQKPGTEWVHFDLTTAMRKKAISLGATVAKPERRPVFGGTST